MIWNNRLFQDIAYLEQFMTKKCSMKTDLKEQQIIIT